MQENKPVLIVGLGNPGAEYSRTRHNVGFMAVRHLAGDDAVWKSGHHSILCSQTRHGRRIIFAMPQTYMNLSGQAVSALMAYYKIPLENVIVIHDDMDIPVGKSRTKVGGGSAGHNGIRSIDASVGAEYRRVRIGISHPRDFGLPIKPADWVLGRIPDEQMVDIMRTIDDITIE